MKIIQYVKGKRRSAEIDIEDGFYIETEDGTKFKVTGDRDEPHQLLIVPAKKGREIIFDVYNNDPDGMRRLYQHLALDSNGNVTLGDLGDNPVTVVVGGSGPRGGAASAGTHSGGGAVGGRGIGKVTGLIQGSAAKAKKELAEVETKIKHRTITVNEDVVQDTDSLRDVINAELAKILKGSVPEGMSVELQVHEPTGDQFVKRQRTIEIIGVKHVNVPALPRFGGMQIVQDDSMRDRNMVAMQIEESLIMRVKEPQAFVNINDV